MIVEISSRISNLSKMSNYIRKIVDTVDAISEEMNLLALNAVIEAARAGEAGKDKDEVVLSIESITTIAEESSASTEEVSASVEEQTATIEEIVRMTEELKNMANKLENVIREFQIDK